LLFAPQPVACCGPGPLSLGLTLLTLAQCRYYGDRTGQQTSLSSLLGLLLDSDLDRLPAILDTLSKGQPWRGTVLVRAPLLTRPPDPSHPGGMPTSPSASLAEKSQEPAVAAPSAPASVVQVSHEAHEGTEQTWEGDSAAVDTWHEVEAVPMADPVTGRQMVMLLQRDVTEQVAAERALTAMTETQLNMLQQMFPRHVLELLLGKGLGGLVGEGRAATSLARSHDSVTILFLDVVGFTSMSEQAEPEEVMAFLNELFSLFDELADQYGVYKVETAGDCYIVAGGLMQHEEHGFVSVGDAATCAAQGAERVMAFAKALIRCSRAVSTPHDQQPCRVRVGIHTGPVVSGLIGRKLSKFSIFGDTMDTASRMESTSKPGCIQVSAATHSLLTSHSFEPTGSVEIKGKGAMETFLWDPAAHPEQDYLHPAEQAKEAAAILNHGLGKAMALPQLSAASQSGWGSPKRSSSTTPQAPDRFRRPLSPVLTMLLPALSQSSLVHQLAYPAPEAGATPTPSNQLLARFLEAPASSCSQPFETEACDDRPSLP
jgi:class 3 adenylate cyclase